MADKTDSSAAALASDVANLMDALADIGLASREYMQACTAPIVETTVKIRKLTVVPAVEAKARKVA